MEIFYVDKKCKFDKHVLFVHKRYVFICNRTFKKVVKRMHYVKNHKNRFQTS